VLECGCRLSEEAITDAAEVGEYQWAHRSGHPLSEHVRFNAWIKFAYKDIGVVGLY